MDIAAWTGLPIEVIIIGIISWTVIELTKLIVNAITAKRVGRVEKALTDDKPDEPAG